MDYDELMQQIKSAFADAPAPSEDSIVCHKCEECFALLDDVRATRRTSFRILGSSRALISFHSFQMMRSVFIFRRFFALPRSNRIRLLHSLLYIHCQMDFGCSPEAAILRRRSKP